MTVLDSIIYLTGIVTLIFFAGVIIYYMFNGSSSLIFRIYYKHAHRCNTCDHEDKTLVKDPCAYCKRYKHRSDYWQKRR